MAILNQFNEIPIPPEAYVNHATQEVSIFYKDVVDGRRRRHVIGRALPNGKMLPTTQLRKYYPEIWESAYGEDKSLNGSLSVGLYGAALSLGIVSGLYRCVREAFGNEIGNAFLDYAMFCLAVGSNAVYRMGQFLDSHASFSTHPKSDSWYSRVFNETTPSQISTFKTLWIQELKSRYNLDSVWLSIDGTNVDCKASNASLPEKGKSKTGNSCPIVGQIMAVATGINLPVTWFTYKGSIPDSGSFTTIIEFLAKHDIKIKGVILDRGFNTQAIIDKCKEFNFDWVMMLKGNCLAHTEMQGKHAEAIRLNWKYYLQGRSLFAITDKARIFNNSKEESSVSLYYSLIDGAERADRLLENISAQIRNLEEKIAAGKKDIEIPNDYKDYIYIEDDGGKLTVQTNGDKINQATGIKGFFSIASSLDLTAQEKNEIYGLRNVSEKTFSISKSELGFNTLRVQSDTSIQARMSCGFIGSVLRGLFEYVGKVESIPTNILIDGLSDARMMCMSISNEYVYETVFKVKYQDILDNLGATRDVLRQIAQEAAFTREGKHLSHVRTLSVPNKAYKRYGFKPPVEVVEEEKSVPQEKAPVEKRKPGRPKGRKNNKTLEREALEPPKPKRGRGRPKGSKNKKTLEREALELQMQKRGRGRPKGSKNKKTLEREALELQNQKRGRGRPKGSKNKKTLAAEAAAARAAKRGPGRPRGPSSNATQEPVSAAATPIEPSSRNSTIVEMDSSNNVHTEIIEACNESLDSASYADEVSSASFDSYDDDENHDIPALESMTIESADSANRKQELVANANDSHHTDEQAHSSSKHSKQPSNRSAPSLHAKNVSDDALQSSMSRPDGDKEPICAPKVIAKPMGALEYALAVKAKLEREQAIVEWKEMKRSAPKKVMLLMPESMPERFTQRKGSKKRE